MLINEMKQDEILNPETDKTLFGYPPSNITYNIHK